MAPAASFVLVNAASISVVMVAQSSFHTAQPDHLPMFNHVSTLLYLCACLMWKERPSCLPSLPRCPDVEGTSSDHAQKSNLTLS